MKNNRKTPHASRGIFWIVFPVIAGLSILMNFFRVSTLGYFMMDEERDAFLVRRLLVDHRPLLIGGVVPGGVNLGPLFFYVSAIPYTLSNLNPIGPAWAAGLIGVIGVLGVFWVGKELFGKRVGVMAMVFAGFSILNIIYHRPWWPLTMSQLVTLGVYLCLFKLTGKSINSDVSKHCSKRSWLLFLTGFLTLGAQSDPSTLSLIPLSIIWLWWHRRRTGLTRKHYLAAVGLFLLAHATWVVFEFRHDFQSIRAFLGLFQGLSLAYARESPYWTGPIAVLKMTAATIYRLFFITGPLDVTKQISPAEVFLNPRFAGVWWPGSWGMLLVIGYYVISSLVRQSKIKQESPRRTSGRLLAMHFLISLTGILAYTTVFPGYVHEWMWFFMFPGFFLIAGSLLVKLASSRFAGEAGQLGKLVKFTTFATVLGWAVWQVSLFLKLDNSAGLGKKLTVVRAAQTEIAGRPYELRSEGEGAFRYGGWRYLFTLYGDPPVKSYMDYVYQDWVYPKSDVKPEVIVKVVSSTEDIIRYETEK